MRQGPLRRPIIVYPPAAARFAAEENIIIGNVALYGATSGEAFISGMAGERFAVRNSGVDAVVEAVGDHGCEYMTGGRVVVLGPVGRNFGAGMSGGIAYILDDSGAAEGRINRQMVGSEKLEDPGEIAAVKTLVERHHALTGSKRARAVLDAWETSLPRFIRVVPRDYQRMLSCISRAHEQGLSGDEAIMAAFEENAHDLARVGGN